MVKNLASHVSLDRGKPHSKNAVFIIIKPSYGSRDEGFWQRLGKPPRLLLWCRNVPENNACARLQSLILSGLAIFVFQCSSLCCESREHHPFETYSSRFAMSSPAVACRAGYQRGCD